MVKSWKEVIYCEDCYTIVNESDECLCLIDQDIVEPCCNSDYFYRIPPPSKP